MTVGVVSTILKQLKIKDMKLQNNMVFLIPKMGAIFPLKNEPIAIPNVPSNINTVIMFTTYPFSFWAPHSSCTSKMKPIWPVSAMTHPPWMLDARHQMKLKQVM